VDELPPPPPPASIPRKRAWLWLLPAVVPLAFGGFLGYQAGYQQSLGGFNTLGAAYIGFIIGALVVIVGLVGVGNALRPAGRGRVASRYAFAAAGLLAAGAAGGYAAVPLLDVGYHPPVVLGARGEASITLEGVPTFEPRTSGRADCWSVADGPEVGEVVALSLGQLNGHLLRADIFLPVQGRAQGSITLFVDAAHLEGAIVPRWEVMDPEIDSSPGGTTGSMSFAEVAILEDPELLAPPDPSWPATLSGQIRWACDPWLAPDATAPPATAAHISLDLAGVDWSATTGPVGSCEFESDGSVWTVTGDQVGLLQGKPMSVSVDLGGDPRRGDEVFLMLGVQVVAPSQGASIPLAALVAATSGRAISWVELVTIEEIADGGLSGRLSFSDLPNEGTQVPTWPATLSGELSWVCGQ